MLKMSFRCSALKVKSFRWRSASVLHHSRLSGHWRFARHPWTFCTRLCRWLFRALAFFLVMFALVTVFCDLAAKKGEKNLRFTSSFFPSFSLIGIGGRKYGKASRSSSTMLAYNFFSTMIIKRSVIDWSVSELFPHINCTGLNRQICQSAKLIIIFFIIIYCVHIDSQSKKTQSGTKRYCTRKKTRTV